MRKFRLKQTNKSQVAKVKKYTDKRGKGFIKLYKNLFIKLLVR